MKSSKPKPATASQIKRRIWDYYLVNRRDFPWRRTTDPYRILVSEMMLQQTQTGRVVGYFERFLTRFPTVQTLAVAAQPEVLALWQGLGYNRRALFLHNTAKVIVDRYGGVVPGILEELVTLPGIGRNTAGAIITYAHNQPAPFIETNIRKTIIHFFFPDQEKVSDQEILNELQRISHGQPPREWYWALVDYGAMLGQMKTVRNDRSKSYRRQSKFEGSNRQLRAQILRFVLEMPTTLTDLCAVLSNDADSIRSAVEQLIREGFLRQNDDKIEVVD